MNKKIAWSVGALVVVALVGWYYYANMNSMPQQAYTSPTSATSTTTQPVPIPASTSTSPVAGPGEHCGGNMMNAPTCGPGYYCAPNPNSHLPFGDVGGTCMPQGGKG